MTNPVDQPTVSSPSFQGSAADSTAAFPEMPAANTPGPSQPAPGFNAKGKVDRTAVSGVWIGAILAAIVLIVLIIFIAQNSTKATIHFLFLSGHFSIGLTILLAAVIGVLLVAIPGSVRILQLRRALRKNVPTGRKK